MCKYPDSKGDGLRFGNAWGGGTGVEERTKVSVGDRAQFLGHRGGAPDSKARDCLAGCRKSPELL